MMMGFLDWLVVLVLVAAVAYANYVAGQLNRSVADFLAANRMAGQYLLAVGEGTAGLGAVTVVAYLEQVYSAGFVPTYWMMVLSPISMVLAVTGFVRYRFRLTKARIIIHSNKIGHHWTCRLYMSPLRTPIQSLVTERTIPHLQIHIRACVGGHRVISTHTPHTPWHAGISEPTHCWTPPSQGECMPLPVITASHHVNPCSPAVHAGANHGPVLRDALLQELPSIRRDRLLVRQRALP